jgi:hypothetical protein
MIQGYKSHVVLGVLSHHIARERVLPGSVPLLILSGTKQSQLKFL